MRHLFRHEPHQGAGKIDIYADVTAKDFTFSSDQTAFVRSANKGGFATLLIVHEFQGTTLMAFPKAISESSEASVVAAVLTTLGQPSPVIVSNGSGQWDKY